MSEADPGPVGDASRRASALVVAGQYARAAEVARTALATDPDNAGLLVTLSLALTHSLDGAGACEAADRAIAAAPDWAAGHGALGDAHLIATRHWPAAVEAYNQAIRLDPSEYSYFTGRAQATLHLAPEGKFLTSKRRTFRDEVLRSARRDADYALHLEPHAPLSHVTLGKVLIATEQPLAAKAAADRALAIDPTNDVALQVRGIALQQLGDVRSASEAFVSAARQNPRSEAPMQLLRGLKVTGPLSFFLLWIALRVAASSGASGPVAGILGVLLAAGVIGYYLLKRRQAARQIAPEARRALQLDRQLRRSRLTGSWLRFGRRR